MKIVLLAVVVLGLLCDAPAQALTVKQKVTPESIRSNAGHISVKVVKRDDGRLDFIVVLRTQKPKYVVSHLVVRQGGRILTESVTPAFTRNPDNTFRFSLAPEVVDSSEFSVGVSEVSVSQSAITAVPGTRDHAVQTEFARVASIIPAPQQYAIAIPGTIEYQFPLADFVAAEQLQSEPK